MGNCCSFDLEKTKEDTYSVKSGITIADLKERMRLRGLRVIWVTGNRCVNTLEMGKAIADHFGYKFIDVANMLRREAKYSTERGEYIRAAINLRINIPSSILIAIMREKIYRKNNKTKGFVFNGFPNNKRQAEIFLEELVDVHYILFVKQDLILNGIDKELFRLKIRSTYGIKSELQSLSYEEIGAAAIRIRLLGAPYTVNVVTLSKPIQQIWHNIEAVLKDE